MRKVLLYCGGNFEFQYKDFTPEKLLTDYRTEIVQGVDNIVYQPKNDSKSVIVNDNVEYIGPFYFYENDLDGAGVVKTEYNMVEKCTDAIFLVDNVNIPGTVSEIVHASMLKKNVAIFYVERIPDDGEPEQVICNMNWYPIEFAKQVNENTDIIRCKDRDAAKAAIKTYVETVINFYDLT